MLTEAKKRSSARNFYKRTRKNARAVVECRRNNKAKLLEAMGGKCQICGYDKPCLTAYHFHHIDPATKSFTISRYMSRSFDALFEEAKKCILLCSNCHSEIHDEEYKKQRAETAQRWEHLSDEDIEKLALNRLRPPSMKDCLFCLESFYPRHKTQKFCSRKCRADSAAITKEVCYPKRQKAITLHLKNCAICNSTFETTNPNKTYCSKQCQGLRPANRKVTNRPSKEELEHMIGRSNWTAIGKKYGVSDNAVKKWAKAYGIAYKVRSYNRKNASES